MKNVTVKNSSIVAAKEQISCDLAGEAAILQLESGIYYGLDGVGARVWNLIQETRTIHEVLVTLLEEYDVDPDLCEHDLLALLQELTDHGLVVVQDALNENQMDKAVR